MNLIGINLRLEGIISPHMYTVLKKKIKRYSIVLWVFIKMAKVDQAQLKGPFLESPGLFGAGKLFYVCRFC